MVTEPSARVYLDANVFINAVEGVEELAGPAISLLDSLRLRRGRGVTSEITLLETLCKANIQGGATLRRRYLNLLVFNGYFQLVPVSREVIYEAAAYRERVQLAAGSDKRNRNVIDAIHVASALTEQCFLFVTEDTRIKLPRPFRKVSPHEALVDLE